MADTQLEREIQSGQKKEGEKKIAAVGGGWAAVPSERWLQPTRIQLTPSLVTWRRGPPMCRATSAWELANFEY